MKSTPLLSREKDLSGSLPLFASLLIAAFIALHSPLATAFGLFPEFQSVSEKRAGHLSSSALINSEYASDYLTYLKPFAWEREFWRNGNAFDLSTGSLSGENFQIQDRLKMRHELVPDRLQFRFTYFAERDFETDQDHKVLELVAKIYGPWSFSVSGESSLFKSEDDVAAALLFQPNDTSEHRLFNNWIDYSRNGRNLASDRFDKKPLKYGVAGYQFLDDWFFKYALTHSPSAAWRFPDSRRLYEWSETLALLHVQKKIDPNWELGFETLLDEVWEKESALPGGTLTGNQLRRQRLLLRSEAFRHLDSGYHLRGGIAFFYRDYNGDNEQRLFRDHLPFLGLGLPAVPYESFTWRNEFSLESTFHQLRDDLALNTLRSSEIEGRLNWKIQFEFSTHAQLALLLTVDLDAFGTGRTWEGGNAQFRFDF